MAHNGKFNSQIHVEYPWETPQDMYDSEDDLDERVCNDINYFIQYAFFTIICAVVSELFAKTSENVSLLHFSNLTIK